MRRGAATALLVLAACANNVGAGAKGADDQSETEASPAASVPLAEGTRVCISGIAGVRYGLEDALTDRGLQLMSECISADVEIEESGAEGAWLLKHRALGEEWQSCESSANDRQAFLGECLGAFGAVSAASE